MSKENQGKKGREWGRDLKAFWGSSHCRLLFSQASKHRKPSPTPRMSPKPYKEPEDQQGDKGSRTTERNAAMCWNSLAQLEQSRVVDQSTGRCGGCGGRGPEGEVFLDDVRRPHRAEGPVCCSDTTSGQYQGAPTTSPAPPRKLSPGLQ